MTTTNTCDVCKHEIEPEGATIDVMISLTLYHDGKPVKTMQGVNEGVTLGHEYVVVCQECQDRLIESWHQFLINLGVVKS